MRFRGFDCIHQAEGHSGNSLDALTNDWTIPLGHYACFGTTFNQIKRYKYSDVTYHLYLFKENIPGRDFNLCTMAETKKILRDLQRIVPFSYKFEEGEYTDKCYQGVNTKFNVLTFRIVGTPAQHIWTATLFRAFYEAPYNIAAKEACLLQSTVKVVDGFDLTKENWVNLYLTLCAVLSGGTGHGVNDIRSRNSYARTYREWYQKLKSVKSSYVCSSINDVGGRFSNAVQRDVIRIESQQEFDRGIESRASKYVAAYKEKLSWRKK